MQGTPEIRDFRTSILYGPFFPWHEMPFVPESKKQAVVELTKTCLATLHSRVSEATLQGKLNDPAVGTALADEMSAYMGRVYGLIKEDYCNYTQEIARESQSAAQKAWLPNRL